MKFDHWVIIRPGIQKDGAWQCSGVRYAQNCQAARQPLLISRIYPPPTQDLSGLRQKSLSWLVRASAEPFRGCAEPSLGGAEQCRRASRSTSLSSGFPLYFLRQRPEASGLCDVADKV